MNENLIQIVYDVIGETYLHYDLNQVVSAVARATTENYLKCFTNQGKNGRTRLVNKLRESGETLEPNTLNYTFFEGVIDCYVDSLVRGNESKQYTPKNDSERDIIATYEKFKNHPRCNELMRQQVIAQKQISPMYFGNTQMMKNCMTDIVGTVAEIYTYERQLEASKMQVSNQRFHAGNMEKISKEMISGLTHYKEGSLSIGNMSASTSIGKKRKNQEDALLLKQHPQNPNFKILVVADGMGGGDSGEVVSDYTVSKLSEWFESLPAAYYKDADRVAYALGDKIKEISEDMYQKYGGRAGSTFVGGIVCERETVVSNIGDSRAYVYSDKTKELTQVSEDESLVEILYKTKQIKNRDDMRFHKDSNKILQHIGASGEVVPRTCIIPNEDYDKLILVSDGVSDCLSDKDILTITKRTPREQLAQMLVQSALDNISYARPELSKEEYYSQISGGKDNTTAAVLDKKMKSRRGDEYDI